MEQWKKIAGTDDYEVSDLGRVRSIKNGKVLVMSGCTSKRRDELGRGYKAVNIRLCRGAKPVLRYVHRLVAEAFIPNLTGGVQVNHLDFNPENNAAENLEWATALENTRYSRDAGRLYGKTGELDEIQVLDMRISRLSGMPIKELSKKYGCSTNHVVNICSGHRYSRLPGAVKQKRGTKLDLVAIRAMRSAGASLNEIASEYGITFQTVSMICTRSGCYERI